MQKVKKVLLMIFVALFLIVFIQNAIFNGESIFGSVDFRFLLWTQRVPIIILLLLAAFVGYIVGVFQMFFRRRKTTTTTEVTDTEEE